mgnify:CR=1 FL=1|jgi:hypothetical protein
MLEQGKRTETERDGKVDGLLGETAVAVLGPVGERAAHRLLAEGRDDCVRGASGSVTRIFRCARRERERGGDGLYWLIPF